MSFNKYWIVLWHRIKAEHTLGIKLRDFRTDRANREVARIDEDRRCALKDSSWRFSRTIFAFSNDARVAPCRSARFTCIYKSSSNSSSHQSTSRIVHRSQTRLDYREEQRKAVERMLYTRAWVRACMRDIAWCHEYVKNSNLPIVYLKKVIKRVKANA